MGPHARTHTHTHAHSHARPGPGQARPGQASAAPRHALPRRGAAPARQRTAPQRTAPHCARPHCTTPHRAAHRDARRTAPRHTAQRRTPRCTARGAPHSAAPRRTPPRRTAPHCGTAGAARCRTALRGVAGGHARADDVRGRRQRPSIGRQSPGSLGGLWFNFVRCEMKCTPRASLFNIVHLVPTAVGAGRALSWESTWKHASPLLGMSWLNSRRGRRMWKIGSCALPLPARC